jgi:integrase
MSAKKRSWPARIYIGRDEHGKQQFWWGGRFPTKRQRDDAVARARTDKPWLIDPERMTCGELIDRYLLWYEERWKGSSHDTAKRSLKTFRKKFGHRPVASIHPVEAEDWARTVVKSDMPRVVALFSYAKAKRIVDHNPFTGLGGGRGNGRADQDPPTVKQLERLLDACSVLGDYASQMVALIVFAAYTGMRPGELYELRWTDIDLATNRIHVARRLYRGKIDTPKNGKAKTIALPPPARDVLMRQPTRAMDLVFVSKRGCQLTAPTVCQYWKVVCAHAHLDFDLYLATKHYGVHLLYKLGLSQRAIAAQMGWSERSVEGLLRTYGHLDLVALAEVDALYADLSDAPVTHDPSQTA